MFIIPRFRVFFGFSSFLLFFCLAAAICADVPVFVPEKIPMEGVFPEGQNDNFQFVILGDKSSGGEDLWPLFDQAVDSINLLSPDFVITTGDHIPGHMEERRQWDLEWAEYREHARRLQCPLIMTPGNHDISNTQCHQFWMDDFGATYFQFTYKKCLFLVLNTEEERFDGRGPRWEAMMQFAEKALEDAKDCHHTFLFFHKPMWDDPRFLRDWGQLLQWLGERPFTAVAGHEHYLSVSRQGSNLLIVMNATAAGVHESEVLPFGGFHAFAPVTVRSGKVHVSVMEPNGIIHPVDIAPSSFRKKINREVVLPDADFPDCSDPEFAETKSFALVKNPFEKPIAVRLNVTSLQACRWELKDPSALDINVKSGDAQTEVSLQPGEEKRISLACRVPAERIGTPPLLEWEVQYEGQWLKKEIMYMEEEAALPLYPAHCWKMAPAWQQTDPFIIGDINTAALPRDPEKANLWFVNELGPEKGYEKGVRYDGGQQWHPAESCARGLVNLNGLLGTLDLAATFSSCRVFSPEAQNTHGFMYADNYAQLYLNGSLVEDGQALRGPSPFVYVPLHLNTGWNVLSIKTVNNRGDWFLRFLVADPQNNLCFDSWQESERSS